jgi:hypothetical protein
MKADRFCGICAANTSYERHDEWCPNAPENTLRAGAYVDEEADVNDWDFTPGLEADIVQSSYRAPEPPTEDWGLRDKCLEGPLDFIPPYNDKRIAYFIHPDGVYVDGVKITGAYRDPGAPAAVGIGGAPTRATTLPESASERKQYPVASGVLDYFPDALVAISNLSQRGNDQHNPGLPLHWDRSKSGDEADTMIRHFLQRGSLDTDGVRHTVKMAWRALALLQKEIEQEAK